MQFEIAILVNFIFLIIVIILIRKNSKVKDELSYREELNRNLCEDIHSDKMLIDDLKEKLNKISSELQYYQSHSKIKPYKSRKR